MDYTVKPQPMFSGIAEAEARKYRMYCSPNSKQIWLVADQENAADNIYVGYDYHTGSDGFGGRKITFDIVNGDCVTLHGPWHSNSNSLYQATGVDIRNKHLTFVVVSEGRDNDKRYRTIMKNVLYIDRNPAVGFFDRGDMIASRFAAHIDRPVFRYSLCVGGSSCGPVYPDGTSYKDYVWDPETKTLTRKE